VPVKCFRHLFPTFASTFSGPEWDSQSSGSESDDKQGVAEKKSTKKNPKAANIKTPPSNVLYIGHLPKHFEEHELLQFLKQFGSVLHVRLKRSKKTGGSRGYAFVQMASAAVAATVADTLSGYLVGGKRLVCHRVPPEQVHKKMLYNIQRKKPSRDRPERSLEKMKQITQKMLAREKRKRAQLAEMGIDYDFPGCGEKTDEPAKKKQHKESKESVDEKEGKKESSETISPSDSKRQKKRKESIDNTIEEKNKTKSKKLDEPIALVENTRLKDSKGKAKDQTKEKQRKESINSVHSVDSKSQKKRKESLDNTLPKLSPSMKPKEPVVPVDSARSVDSKSKSKKRKESIGSVHSEDSKRPKSPKESNKPKNSIAPADAARSESIKSQSMKLKSPIASTERSKDNKSATKKRKDLTASDAPVKSDKKVLEAKSEKKPKKTKAEKKRRQST
jgi:RNA recognition motif-containing protein